MAFFNEFPNTRTYDKDLGWLIHVVGQLQIEVRTFIENNTINIPDQITWDITKQYTRNTLVIDYDGTAYLSKQPVPIGIAITNTDYWMPIFNYDDSINTLRANIATNERNHTTASAERHAGDLVWLGNALYKVTADMPAGTAYIAGTNVELYTIEDYLLFLKGAIAAETQAREGADTTLQGNIDAEVLARQGADTALQGNIDAEVLARQGADHTLQDAIDAEVENREAAIVASSIVINVKNYGALGDGTTDDTAAINNAISHLSEKSILYFPAGTYLYTNSFVLPSNITVHSANAVFKAGSAKPLFICDYGTSHVEFTGTATYDGNGQSTGTQTYDYRTNCAFLAVGNADNTDFDAYVTVNMQLTVIGVSSTGRIYAAHNAKHIKICGNTYTTSAAILFAVGCSYLEVSGIRADYQNAVPDPCIMDNDVDATGHTFSDVYFHDIVIKGNNNLTLSPINIGRSNATGGELQPSGQPFDTINRVTITDCTISGVSDWGDGIDVLECVGVVISNCHVTTANEGIVICSTGATVTNCIVQNCRGLGIALGDPNIGFNWAIIDVSNCVLIDNGRVEAQWVYPAQIGICEEEGYNISTVTITGCTLVNIGNTKYGFYCIRNQGGSNIILSNNFMSGNVAPMHSLAAPGMIRYYNNPGLNPRGILATQPAVAKIVTNTYESPARVFINNGATEQALMLNGVPIATLHANESYMAAVDCNESIGFSTSVEGVTWAWALQ